MTQPVKLHILSPDHTGPVVRVADQLPTREFVQDGPSLRAALHPDANARMAIFKGTLYTDTEPLEWNAVDADRASALGYGPSDPWPFPDAPIIKPIRVQDITVQGQQEQARRNKVGLLNTHILPKYGALLTDKAVRVVEAKTNRTTMLDFYEFDALTIGQLVNRIQTRLQ